MQPLPKSSTSHQPKFSNFKKKRKSRKVVLASVICLLIERSFVGKKRNFSNFRFLVFRDTHFVNKNHFRLK